MTPSPSRLVLALAVLWMAAMTWRIYPQFGDTIRVEGRLTTVSDYVGRTCGQRVGPAASTCLGEAAETAQLGLREEQGKSLLLILAPLVIYVLLWWPVRLARAHARRRRRGIFRAA
jgi:hypothetical protein